VALNSTCEASLSLGAFSSPEKTRSGCGERSGWLRVKILEWAGCPRQSSRHRLGGRPLREDRLSVPSSGFDSSEF